MRTGPFVWGASQIPCLKNDFKFFSENTDLRVFDLLRGEDAVFFGKRMKQGAINIAYVSAQVRFIAREKNVAEIVDDVTLAEMF